MTRRQLLCAALGHAEPQEDLSRLLLHHLPGHTAAQQPALEVPARRIGLPPELGSLAGPGAWIFTTASITVTPFTSRLAGGSHSPEGAAAVGRCLYRLWVKSMSSGGTSSGTEDEEEEGAGGAKGGWQEIRLSMLSSHASWVPTSIVVQGRKGSSVASK